MNARALPGAAWIAGTCLALVAAGIAAAVGGPGLLPGISDESLLVPLARKAWESGLYPGDLWLDLSVRVFGRAYSLLLGGVLQMADDPVTAGRVLAVPFHAVFLAGCFRIADRAAGRAAAWVAVALLSVIPPALAAFVSPDLAWPLGAGASLPRDLVFALLPWAWLARDAALVRDRLGLRCLAGLGTGLLANLHPLTALHALALFFVLDVLQRPTRRGLRDAIAIGIVSIHGAVPYLIQWGAFPRTPGVVPREVLLWRVEGIGAWTPSLWAERIEVAAWMVAAALVLARGRTDPAGRPLRLAAVTSLVFCAAAPVLNLALAGIQFDRANRFAVWFAALVVAITVPPALRARDWRALAIGALCVTVAIAGRVVVAAATGSPRGPVEWVARRVEVRFGRDAPAAPELVPDRPRPTDPSRDPALAAAFRGMCRWVRGNTPPSSLFLVPPEEFGAFRAYAVRPIVISRKEGGFALSFLGGRGVEWFDDYRTNVLAFAGDPALLAAESGVHRAAYAVLDVPDAPVPDGWKLLHSEPPYRVFRTAVK